MDNVSHIGREVEANALGRAWRFARWDRGVWVAFADWAKGKLPDPIEAMAKSIDQVAAADMLALRRLLEADQKAKARYEADLAKCTGDQERAALPRPVTVADKYTSIADMLAQRALDKASSCVSFNSPEMQSLMTNPVGSGYIVWLLLRKHQPDVTEDTAFDVGMELAQRGELPEIFNTTQGKVPPRPKNG